MATKVLLVGGGAREHAMARALVEGGAQLYAVLKNRNPGILRLARDSLLVQETDIGKVKAFARVKGVELALVGPEAPLEAGLTDALEGEGIRCASPSENASRLETSKEFMRSLMARNHLPGRIEHWVFRDISEVKMFIGTYDGPVAVKPVGLTGGKGVKLSGDQLQSKSDVIAYASEVLDKKIGGSARVVIEEKVEGEEFTLQAFSDGTTVTPMPAVQDHKRAFEGDFGPNTGGMGSYSQQDHLLPFLRKDEYDQSVYVMQKVVDVLKRDGCPFKGPIYGQFMLTGDGPKVIEFNARFGDPEAMNVLSILESSFLDACEQMASGSGTGVRSSFAHMATVCKYVVPVGYGVESLSGSPLTVDEKSIEKEGARLYYAAVNQSDDGRVLTTTSRALGIVGIAECIAEAEKRCESALSHVKGEYFVRHDIGRPEALSKKVAHMEKIRGRK
jgi:phosphoribosylamine--glycine ligase